MWLLYARAPVPDAPDWPGRRFLAMLDAVAWPALLAAMVSGSSMRTGILGSLALTLCGLFAIRRGGRALWHNERYQFTTWRCGLPLAVLLAIGAALKLMA